MSILKSFNLKLFAYMLATLLLINFIVTYTFNIGNKVASEYSPLIYSVMEIKTDVTSAHLWLEEVLSGDKSESIEEVNKLIDKATRYARTMLDGGSNHLGDFRPLDNEVLEEGIREILFKLEELKQITNKRYSYFETAGIGSKYDMEYDEFYYTLMDDTNTLVGILHKLISNEIKTYKQTYYLSVILISLLIFSVSLLLYRNEKVRSEYEKEKKNKREELRRITEKKNKELFKYINVFSENVIASSSDLKGKITYVSKALCEISGYSEEELLGQPHSILQSSSTPKSVFRDLWETIQSGKTWNGELKNNKKDGGFYWVRARIIPDYDDDDNVIGYSSVRQNITAEKSKEQFLANMSHELRTPLNAILGFVKIIKGKTKEVKTLEYSNIIDTSGKSLLGIIEDILDFSKIESGNISIEKIDFNVKKEFEVIKSLFDAKASEKNIIVDLLMDENLPDAINSDMFRIRQVVSNLLSNAIKFTDPNKKIFLLVSYGNGSININVKDEGKGIAQNKLSHIFDVFAQEDVSTTREYGGTGLGLSISKELVHLLGGELQVKSELGVGSEFYFSIPASMGTYVPELINEEIDFNLEEKKMLVVEDNKTNQVLLGLLLDEMKIKHDIADDGLIAFEMFKDNEYDAILMDENMPNMGGLESTAKILEYEKENDLTHTFIIAVTANALKGDREKFLNGGMDEYVTKPLDKIKLHNCLANLFT